jgi:hypothetical protein
MGLRLNGSTSGYSEINPPAVAGDQTFTLPGTGGDLLTDGSDITAQVKTATNASGTAPIYACRAWVNFNGTGTVAIRASGNVSSITDNGTGDYTVNFTTALADADFIHSGSGGKLTTGSISDIDVSRVNSSASGIRVETVRGSDNTTTDFEYIAVAIFR